MIRACLPTTQVPAWLSILSVVLLLAVDPKDFIRRISCDLMFTNLTEVDDRFRNMGTVSRPTLLHTTSPLSALSWQAGRVWSLHQRTWRPLNIEKFSDGMLESKDLNSAPLACLGFS